MDEQLQLLKDGNEEIFEEFILMHRKEAVNFALNILKDYYLAEDIVQDSFATFYVYRERLKSYSTLKSYLFSIIHNKSVDYIRKNNKSIYSNYDVASTISPEEIVINKEKKEKFMKSFSKLNEEQKNVLYLYAFQQMSYKEIAEVLGISLAKVKVTIFRARKELKASYAEK
ncbi:RNA polymerase sigma factor [Proteiniborus sp. MB09-C3]|uniref:RNA polymerase sigma factor n=1 Tax=Proteiniborus sp. MB09-C3 TaxID=3050072 RepID=UPI00255566F5|nr:RNA polymerase sigma factor [Proteiniborus sp. MB09-C3]WIV11932.1 RNA polymerase sigma factor [Proteiniborus sp. MB09-C3]